MLNMGSHDRISSQEILACKNMYILLNDNMITYRDRHGIWGHNYN